MRVSFISVLALSGVLLSGCHSGGGSDGASANLTGDMAAAVADWERHMIDFGLEAHQSIAQGNNSEEKLAGVYYDSERVFYQIADYTGDSSWNARAEDAEKVYRDSYVVPAGGVVPGYWNFTRGLAEDAQRTGDRKSIDAVKLLAENAAYARNSTDPAETASEELSREVSYAILSYLDAESVGAPRRDRLQLLLDQAKGHLRRWVVDESAQYVRPFMVAITAEALIHAVEVGALDGAEVEGLLANAADWIWAKCWLPDAGAFAYTDRQTDSGGREAAPDLNLLIAPLYGWLSMRTGEPRFLERGDAVFIGGVRGAFLGGSKQFNQNYRWSFDYLRWRGAQRAEIAHAQFAKLDLSRRFHYSPSPMR